MSFALKSNIGELGHARYQEQVAQKFIITQDHGFANGTPVKKLTF
jgi:Zn-dependent M32 family carboxypeptidase